MSENYAAQTDSGPPPVPTWMVTYSDTMGLLVTFFVMMIGFSAMEEEDRSRAPGALSGYPGISTSARLGEDSLITPKDFAGGQVHLAGYESVPDYDPLSYVREGFQLRVQASTVANALRYELTKKGFEITIMAGQLFAQDSTALTAHGDEVMQVISHACRNLPHQMRVKAYPDDLFLPNDRFGSAEELSFARAAFLCSRLVTEGKLSFNQMATAVDLSDGPAAPEQGLMQAKITILRAERGIAQ
jgi:chemotaxis protein MotB